MKPLRIGTRGSALALWQANHFRDALQSACGIAAEIVVIKTSGDQFATAAAEGQPLHEHCTRRQSA
ncbi:MAG: hypothetical protein WB680_11100 [Candidatus Acidiferrales bacterium]